MSIAYNASEKYAYNEDIRAIERLCRARNALYRTRQWLTGSIALNLVLVLVLVLSVRGT